MTKKNKIKAAMLAFLLAGTAIQAQVPEQSDTNCVDDEVSCLLEQIASRVAYKTLHPKADTVIVGYRCKDAACIEPGEPLYVLVPHDNDPAAHGTSVRGINTASYLAKEEK